MAYSILRIENHTANGSLGAMTKHNKREIDVPNCDPEKTILNQELIGTGDYLADVKKVLEEKQPLMQKNSIKAIEHLMTASPEWWDYARKEEKNKFITKSKEFLQELYGPDSKISSFSLHLDESTPHIHAFVVPMRKSKLKGGREVLRLGAKQFTGSPKLLSEMQDKFADKMHSLGLERGVRKSKAKHQSIRKLYGNINQFEEALKATPLKTPEVKELPPRIGINREEWLKSVNRQLREDNEKNLQTLKKIAENKSFLTTKQLLEVSKIENTKKELEKAISDGWADFEALEKIHKANIEELTIEKDYTLINLEKSKEKEIQKIKEDYKIDRSALVEKANSIINKGNDNRKSLREVNADLESKIEKTAMELNESELSYQQLKHELNEKLKDLEVSEKARKSDLKSLLKGTLDPARIDELKRMFDKEERDLRRAVNTPKQNHNQNMKM